MRKRREIVIICILSQLLVCIPVNILDEPNQLQQVAGSTNNITEIAQYDDNYGQFVGLNVTNEIVAVSTLGGGVLFLNHSQKTLEVENSYHNITASDVAIADDTAYVIDRNRITALDISDLSNIAELDTFEQEGGKRNLEIVDNYAYYIYNDKEISILNVSKPNNVQLVSVYQNSKSISSFKINKNCIYGMREGEFFVVNITNRSLLEEIDNFSYEEEEHPSFELENNFAYLLYYNLDKIVVLNITIPSDVTFYKEILLQTSTQHFIIKNERAYLLRNDDIYNLRIEIYNFLDFNSVFSLTNFTSDSVNQFGINEMLLYGDELYLTSSEGIDVLDCNNITNIQLLDSFDAGGHSTDVLVRDNIVLVADGRDGLEVIDIENISEPKKLFQNNYTYCTQVIMYQDFVYILHDNGVMIEILQITENNEILNFGHFESFFTIDSLAVAFPYLYAASYWGISVFYIGSLGNPVEVGEYFEFGFCSDIKVIDNRAYVIMEEEDPGLLKIFDIGYPSNPSLIYSYEINSTGCLEVYDDYAFIGVSGGVKILDVSEPTNIKIVSSFIGEESQTPLSLYHTGNYLCVGSSDGLTILDICNKKEPIEIATIYDGGNAFGITSQENFIFVADGHDNLEILETSFSLTDSSGLKILIYILVPIGAIGIITIGIVFVIKIRKTRKMEI